MRRVCSHRRRRDANVRCNSNIYYGVAVALSKTDASSLPLCTICCRHKLIPLKFCIYRVLDAVNVLCGEHTVYYYSIGRLSFSSNRCRIQGHFPLRHKLMTMEKGLLFRIRILHGHMQYTQSNVRVLCVCVLCAHYRGCSAVVLLPTPRKIQHACIAYIHTNLYRSIIAPRGERIESLRRLHGQPNAAVLRCLCII